jgi:hypothetical protein
MSTHISRRSSKTGLDKIGTAQQKKAFMQVTTSWEAKGQRSIVSLQLEKKVGQLPEALNSCVSSLSADKLSSLAIALLDFSSINDLINWLETNG